MSSFPDYVMIQTVTFCNASCIMCPHENVSKEVSQGAMKWELFKKIIDECSLHKVKRILMYLMNEPLIDKNLVEKINYAKERNPDALIHFVSNGSLLSEKVSQEIIGSKIDYVEFSILGNTKETYENVMRKLNFEKTVNGITRFIEIAKSKKKHPGYINIKILRIPNEFEIDEFNNAIDFWKAKGVLVSPVMGPISRAGNVEWMNKVFKPDIKGCSSIWRNDMVHILYNGDIILCCMDWRREQILGTLAKSSIYDIWNSPHRLEIEKMIRGEKSSPDNFICKRCEASLT